MKIEIDLNEILSDEYGSESLNDSIRRQVIDKLHNDVKAGIGKKIDTEISLAINSEIKETPQNFYS